MFRFSVRLVQYTLLFISLCSPNRDYTIHEPKQKKPSGRAAENNQLWILSVRDDEKVWMGNRIVDLFEPRGVGGSSFSSRASERSAH